MFSLFVSFVFHSKKITVIKYGHRHTSIMKVRISQRKGSELAKGKGRERSELAKGKGRERSELAKGKGPNWSIKKGPN